MGVGFFTTEELIVDETGRLVSDGTWEYKPPSFDTIPRELNVYMLEDSENRPGILSSKGLLTSVPLSFIFYAPDVLLMYF